MKQFIVLFSVLSLFLSACGTLEISLATPAPEEMPADSAFEEIAEPGLSLTSSSEEIQRAMLESATNWLSVWMDGTITQYPLDGTNTPQISHEQVWIDQSTSRFRILSGPSEGVPEKFKASDGLTIIEMDLKTGQSQSYPLPEDAKVKQFVPPWKPGIAYPQPLWGQIGTPLSQLAFSSDRAQNDGTFKPVAMELVAERQTVVVEWTYIQNELPSFRAWLDAETAVILKMQEFGKGGGDTIQSEVVVNRVIYDDIFAEALFRAPASLPQFGDVTGGVNEPTETGTEAPMGRDALGELYFFTLPHQAGQAVQLVRLPGLCVTGQSACPQPEVVKTPFPFNFSLTALFWSPNGNFAAFAYPDEHSDKPNGSQRLWLFDPAANTWTSLFEYTMIDSLFWSPDGNWIAFRVMAGLGGDDVYVIQRDGSGLKNLTSSGGLPDEERPYVMSGWLNGNIIMQSVNPDKGGTVYLVGVTDGHVQPMFDRSPTKALFTPSNDGAWLAYDDYNYDSQKHTLFVSEPDGANPRELASFTGGTLYPIVWSPDSTRLAFAYSTDAQGNNPNADVYVIERNGTGLKQVYRGVTVGGMLFSPDGKFLLVNETTSPTGGHLFLVNLETLEQRILQAPGLSLDSDWYLPSWRK